MIVFFDPFFYPVLCINLGKLKETEVYSLGFHGSELQKEIQPHVCVGILYHMVVINVPSAHLFLVIVMDHDTSYFLCYFVNNC